MAFKMGEDHFFNDWWDSGNEDPEEFAALILEYTRKIQAEAFTKAYQMKAGTPRQLSPVGTGALLSEQQYCFDKGWREGAAALRKKIYPHIKKN
jgi:hypothetical protein